MKRHTLISRWLVGLLLLAGIYCSSPARAQVTLQQVISRENTEFNLTTNEMAVGLDGNVYLTNWGPGNDGDSYLMRINLNGTQKGGAVVNTEAATGVTANASGIIATSHGHYAHCVNIYNSQFALQATQNNFNGSNYDAPADVEVGASGNFYGLDQWNNRILEINSQGTIINIYYFPAQSSEVVSFRVCESSQRFILCVNNGTLVSVDFSGTQHWSSNGYPSGYDMDASGNLYTLQANSNTIYEYDVNDNPLTPYTLSGAPTNQNTALLRISNGQAIVRYCLNTELFRVYSLSTGALVDTVAPAIDSLTATYGSETWTAGAVTPFTITFTSAQVPAPTPTWHVWGRPFDSAVTIGSNGQVTTTYQDFGYTTTNGGQITVPAGCNGLYQIKVTPEQAGWQRGTVSEYFVNDVVEIRPPGAVGRHQRLYHRPAMPIAGTVAITNGSTTVTGTGTSFTTALYAGNTIFVDGQFNTIASITSNTQLTVNNNLYAERERGTASISVHRRPPITACTTMRGIPFPLR